MFKLRKQEKNRIAVGFYIEGGKQYSLSKSGVSVFYNTASPYPLFIDSMENIEIFGYGSNDGYPFFYDIQYSVIKCASQPGAISIKTIDVANPVISNDTICTGNSTELICVSDTFTSHWYQYSWSSVTLSELDTFETPILSSDRTYYVSLFDSSVLCESTRVPVKVTVRKEAEPDQVYHNL